MSYPPPFLPVSIPVQQYSTSPVVSAQPEPVIRLIEKSDKPSHVRLSDDDDATLRIIREEGGPHHYTVFLKVCMLFAKKIISLAEFVMLTNSLYPEKRSVIHAIHELLKSHSLLSSYSLFSSFTVRSPTRPPLCSPSKSSNSRAARPPITSFRRNTCSVEGSFGVSARAAF